MAPRGSMHTLEIDKSTPISRRGAGERSTSTCYESQEETSKKHCHVFRNHLYWLCQGSLLPDLCNWCTVQLIAVHFTKLSRHCGSCTTQFVSLCGLLMVFALSPKRLTHLCTLPWCPCFWVSGPMFALLVVWLPPQTSHSSPEWTKYSSFHRTNNLFYFF